MYDTSVRHTSPTADGIVATGLGKRFGDLWALRDADFAVPAGRVLGLLGHNGAGKTTAIRILTTLTEPTEGGATVAGHDVLRDPGGVRASIGVAGQAATVDGLLTAQANLEMIGRLHRMGRKAARARASELLERSGSPTSPTSGWTASAAACAGASTSPRASSTRRPSSSSTSRRPAWTLPPARSCGTCCASSSPAA